MYRALRSLIARTAFLGSAIYLGMYQGLVGVRWLVIGAVWLLLLAHLVVLHNEEFIAGGRDTRPRFLKAATWVSDIAIVAALLYGGAYITASAYVASCICLAHLYETKGFPLRRSDSLTGDERSSEHRGVSRP